ncbi:MAG: hypothetical protein M1840_008925 [Geoglossum simile]|nr:MAG: hypothetical protein M1840_008925 [Geoglossum simile]
MANLSSPPRLLSSATEILRAMPVLPDLHLLRDYQSADGMSSRSGDTGRASAFHHILPETLVAVERDEVREFRKFVDALPFRFHDYTVPPVGLAFSLEADVRSAVERAIILPTLPVIFAMLPDRAMRNFDLLFRSENAISGTSSRPDALFTTIFQILSQDLEPDLGYEVTQAVEYKGPGSILDCLAEDLSQPMTPQSPLRIKGGPTNAPTDT